MLALSVHAHYAHWLKNAQTNIIGTSVGFGKRVTERLFISKWGRISPESYWCWLKLVLGSSSLLLRGYTDLSLAVGHASECRHSGMRYCSIEIILDQ